MDLFNFLLSTGFFFFYSLCLYFCFVPSIWFSFSFHCLVHVSTTVFFMLLSSSFSSFSLVTFSIYFLFHTFFTSYPFQSRLHFHYCILYLLFPLSFHPFSLFPSDFFCLFFVSFFLHFQSRSVSFKFTLLHLLYCFSSVFPFISSSF